MAESPNCSTAAPASSGRSGRWWVWPAVFVPACLAATCWWLTEPLEDRRGPGELPPPLAYAPPVALAPEEVEAAATPLVWPRTELSGKPAKLLVLKALVQAAERLNKVDSYSGTFRKQERIKGALGAKQTLAMKVRHKPFAIYFKFIEPTKGKEVVFAEGRHDNKVIVHGVGISRFLVPRLAVAPDHPLALADSRHAVTEAGIANLTSRLIRFREKDLIDLESETVLDRVTDDKGGLRLRSVHVHPTFHEGRPFAKVVVLYDPETFFPVDIRNFDWPTPGRDGTLLLAEHYAYEDLNFDVPLTALDFDPANPDYAFHRY